MVGFSSPIDLKLAQSPDPGLPDNVYQECQNIYNAIRTLHQKLADYSGLGIYDPTNYITIGQDPSQTFQIHRYTPILVQASVAITAGQLVNLHSSGGLRVRLADASAIGTRADGFAPQSIGNGNIGIVYLFLGYIPGGGGLSVASTYYLSASSPGGITTTAPGASGTIKQEVGRSGTANDFFMRIGTPFVNP